MLLSFWIDDVAVEDIKIIGKFIRVTYRFSVRGERIPTVLTKTITYRKHNWLKEDNTVDFVKVGRASDTLFTTNYPILNGVVNSNSRNYKSFWQLNRVLWRTSNQNFAIKSVKRR